MPMRRSQRSPFAAPPLHAGAEIGEPMQVGVRTRQQSPRTVARRLILLVPRVRSPSHCEKLSLRRGGCGPVLRRRIPCHCLSVLAAMKLDRRHQGRPSICIERSPVSASPPYPRLVLLLADGPTNGPNSQFKSQVSERTDNTSNSLSPYSEVIRLAQRRGLRIRPPRMRPAIPLMVELSESDERKAYVQENAQEILQTQPESGPATKARAAGASTGKSATKTRTTVADKSAQETPKAKKTANVKLRSGGSRQASHKAASKPLKPKPAATVTKSSRHHAGRRRPRARLRPAARRRRQASRSQISRAETGAVLLSPRRHARLHQGGDRLHPARKASLPPAGPRWSASRPIRSRRRRSFRNKHQLVVPLGLGRGPRDAGGLWRLGRKIHVWQDLHGNYSHHGSGRCQRQESPGSGAM